MEVGLHNLCVLVSVIYPKSFNCYQFFLSLSEVQASTVTNISPLHCVGIPAVANAYISNEALIDLGNNKYQGRIYLTCNPGYIDVNTLGGRWVTCENGVWSTLPVCTGLLSI